MNEGPVSMHREKENWTDRSNMDHSPVETYSTLLSVTDLYIRDDDNPFGKYSTRDHCLLREIRRLMEIV